MIKSVYRWLRAAAVGATVLLGSPALANEGVYTAPNRSITDSLGIDIGTNEYDRQDTFLTIGDPKNGGLSWRYLPHLYVSAFSGIIEFWQVPGASAEDGEFVKVAIEGRATVFSGNCVTSGCVNTSGDGATLSKTATNWIYTDGTGTVYTFDIYSSYTQVDGVNVAVGQLGRLQSILKPNGNKITIGGHYDTSNCYPTSCRYFTDYVVSDQGYGLKYTYIANGLTISAANFAVHTCDSHANCDAYDQTITEQNATITSSLNGQSYNVVQIIDPAGISSYYSYGTINAYQQAQNPLGYQRQDSLYYYKAPNGYEAIVTRDSASRVTTFQDNRGTWTYSYGSETLTIAKQPTGFRIITLKDPSGNTVYTAKIERPDATIDYMIDANGKQTTYTNTFTAPNSANGSSLGYFRVTNVAKPEGNSVTYAYDGRGNVTSVTNTPKSGSGLSATTAYANYDTTCANLKTCNKPNWTQDAKGNKTYYTYDPTHGSVTSVTSPADNAGLTPKTVTTYAQFTAQTKTSSGAMTNAGTVWLPQTTSACATAVTCDGTVNQLKTTTAYATYNLLPSSVTAASGDNSKTATTSFTYDAVGNVTVADGPRTDVDDTSYKTYDADRRPVFEIAIDPDGTGPLKRTMVHHVYTGVLETQTETGSGTATNGSDFTRASYLATTYDAMGRKASTASYIDGNGTAQTLSQFNYDVRGRLNCLAVRMNQSVFGSISGTDACSLGTTGSFGPDRITKTLYDGADQVTDLIRAYGVTTANGFPATLQQTYVHYAYTNNGLKQSETDANGNKTMYIYDGFDRLSQIQYPSTTIGSGNVNTADYELYGYDANGNRASWRRRDNQTINYSYDNLNRQTLKDLPGTTSGDVCTAYDLMGHVKSNRFGSSSGSGTTYYYDGLGRLDHVADINGRTVWYSYNQASVRTQLTFPDMNNVGFGLDNANRLSTVGWNGSTGLLTQSYDNLGRISGIGKAGGSTSYGYDNVGRLTSMTNDLTGTIYDVNWTFDYNPGGQLATSTASTTVYDYKETASSSDSPTYDGLNRDARLVGTTSACPAGGYDARQNLICDGLTNRSYTYDIENRLLTAGGSGSGGAITLSYDPEGRLSSYTAAGTTTTFLYDGVNLIAEYNGGSTTPLRRYIHGTGTDNPLVWLEGSSNSDMRWFYTDYHGSVIGYSDGAGNLAQLYKYGPYGEPKDINNADSWSGSRFRYTGQTMLFEARLYYYKARIYDPKWGRFLQTDPIGSKDDLDLYAYAAGDPVNKGDPTGTVAAECYCYYLVGGDDDSQAIPPEDEPTPVKPEEQRNWENAPSDEPPPTDWWERIFGKGQNTRAGGQDTSHASDSDRIAEQRAKEPPAPKVYKNVSITTATNGEVKSSLRPDVITVYRDANGKISEVGIDEVCSSRQECGYKTQQYNNAFKGTDIRVGVRYHDQSGK